jgi:pseudaminic acid cytidylyltransferase
MISETHPNDGERVTEPTTPRDERPSDATVSFVGLPASPDCVAVIPARGGSKRIPRKNIRPFQGVPVIERVIAIALDSGLFSEVIVSTDDAEIARIASGAGASVPFMRSRELAGDELPVKLVVADAIDRLEERNESRSEFVCLVYATAVFLTAQDLELGLRDLIESRVDRVFSAATYAAPIQRSWRRDSDGLGQMIWPKHRFARSQDLEEAFFDCGQFAWGTSDYWRTVSDETARTRLHMIPRHRAHDLDTEEDWVAAELAYESLMGHGRT